MKLKSFSPAIKAAIEAALNEELKQNSSPIAAFDADGTLWKTDMGEGFFQFEIKNQLLPLPENPWQHYRRWKESGDPKPAYLWLAQIHNGIPLELVRQWTRAFLQSIQPIPLFEEQVNLISDLQGNGVTVYIVTASITWSVEPGAQLFGIPYGQVIGVQTKVIDHKISDVQDGEITYRDGKRNRLLEITGGRAPFLSCGNTMGDLHLLESSSKIKLAVRSADESSELYVTESELARHASKNGWLTTDLS